MRGPADHDALPLSREIGEANGTGKVDATSISLIESPIIELAEERLSIDTRRAATGIVRVSSHTEHHEERVAVELDRYKVETTRVPIGRVVDEVPATRTEGDTTIVPVMEERLVVVKQLFLKEELHIRHVVEREVVIEPVTLRRQRLIVERRDVSGQRIADSD